MISLPYIAFAIAPYLNLVADAQHRLEQRGGLRHRDPAGEQPAHGLGRGIHDSLRRNVEGEAGAECGSTDVDLSARLLGKR